MTPDLFSNISMSRAPFRIYLKVDQNETKYSPSEFFFGKIVSNFNVSFKNIIDPDGTYYRDLQS